MSDLIPTSLDRLRKALQHWHLCTEINKAWHTEIGEINTPQQAVAAIRDLCKAHVWAEEWLSGFRFSPFRYSSIEKAAVELVLAREEAMLAAMSDHVVMSLLCNILRS